MRHAQLPHRARPGTRQAAGLSWGSGRISWEALEPCLCVYVVSSRPVRGSWLQEEHRRRGLASALLRGIMAAAAREGKKTATLQATPAGLGVYTRLGFRQVSLLRALVRAGDSPDAAVPANGQQMASAG